LTTLNLGVVEMGYDYNGSAGKTTGDVAEILEAKYHVIEIFYTQHEADIVKAMENSMAGALESLLMGVPIQTGGNASAAAMEDIKILFDAFITNQEMDKLGYPGVPTAASLKGVNHRLKHPYAKGNPARPSFRDSGLYLSAFKAWLDEG
jgi:hypothetical protein